MRVGIGHICREAVDVVWQGLAQGLPERTSPTPALRGGRDQHTGLQVVVGNEREGIQAGHTQQRFAVLNDPTAIKACGAGLFFQQAFGRGVAAQQRVGQGDPGRSVGGGEGADEQRGHGTV